MLQVSTFEEPKPAAELPNRDSRIRIKREGTFSAVMGRARDANESEQSSHDSIRLPGAPGAPGSPQRPQRSRNNSPLNVPPLAVTPQNFQQHRLASAIHLSGFGPQEQTAAPSPILRIREMQKKGLLPRNSPPINAKVRWRRARTLLKVIRKLHQMSQQIQLYGSPAFPDDVKGYQDMIHRALEGKKQKVAPKAWPLFLIHPNNPFKFIWAIVVVVLLLYAAFVTPIRVAFFETESNDEQGWVVVELIIDILFGLDIVINFFSAYYDEDNNVVTCRRTIIKEYLKSWFIVDFVPCVPLSYLIEASGASAQAAGYNDLLRLLRIPRIYKLIKVLSLAKVFRAFKKGRAGGLTDTIEMNSGILCS
jgi:hypothetical protein